MEFLSCVGLGNKAAFGFKALSFVLSGRSICDLGSQTAVQVACLLTSAMEECVGSIRAVPEIRTNPTP